MDSTKTEEIGDEGRITGPTQTKDAGQWEERQTDKQRRGGESRERRWFQRQKRFSGSQVDIRDTRGYCRCKEVINHTHLNKLGEHLSDSFCTQ